MKRTLGLARATMMGLALAGLILFPGFKAKTLAMPKGAPANTLHFRNPDKKVDITVEIHGKVEGHTIQSVEHLIEEWLHAAHVAVVNADGVDILELHIVVEVHEGHGWHIVSDCGEWHEDHDADTLDAIDEILHAMVNDFIDHFVH